MKKQELIAHLQNLIRDYFDLCAKCGKCRVNCPVYEGVEREEATARAKIALVEGVLSGKIKPGHRFSEIISKCTMCEGCVNVCPNDVRTDLIVVVGRFLSRKKTLSDWFFRVFDKFVLNSSQNLYALLRVVRPFQKAFAENSTLKMPFGKRKYVPKISAEFFREKKTFKFKPPHEKMRVLFFPGCFLDFFFSETSWKVVELLTRMNIGVVVPREWRCCGIPAIGFGDLLSAWEMAKYNAEVIEKEKVDYVITACGSCGATFKKYAPLLFGWSDERIPRVSKKVMDVMEFIYSKEELREKIVETAEGRDMRVFYHPSCHLKRGMDVHEEVISILKSLKGVHLYEMEDKCCGFGGSFNIKHYEFSREINERRIMLIKSEKPNYLLTGSPGCQLHFMETMKIEKIPTRVVHPVVFISKILKNQ